MANGKRGPKSPMTDEHKAALAQGRTEGRAVRNYMAALQSTQAPRRRGRKGKSAAELQEAIMEANDPMERLRLRPLLRAALEEESVETIDMESLQADFIKVLVSYSERTGLTYADWREEGVPAAVLKEAGMSRGQA
jgi:hypothetical protein